MHIHARSICRHQTPAWSGHPPAWAAVLSRAFTRRRADGPPSRLALPSNSSWASPNAVVHGRRALTRRSNLRWLAVFLPAITMQKDARARRTRHDPSPALAASVLPECAPLQVARHVGPFLHTHKSTPTRSPMSFPGVAYTFDHVAATSPVGRTSALTSTSQGNERLHPPRPLGCASRIRRLHESSLAPAHPPMLRDGAIAFAKRILMLRCGSTPPQGPGARRATPVGMSA